MAEKRIIDVGGDIALGLAIGAALGAAFDNIQMGIAIGAATGAASGLIGFTMHRLSNRSTDMSEPIGRASQAKGLAP